MKNIFFIYIYNFKYKKPFYFYNKLKYIFNNKCIYYYINIIICKK